RDTGADPDHRYLPERPGTRTPRRGAARDRERPRRVQAIHHRGAACGRARCPRRRRAGRSRLPAADALRMDDMGERITPIERERLIHRQRMRIRTIVVSFGAAVSSARRDLAVGPAERDALIETWRAWSLDVLERYGRDIEELGEGPRSAT